MLSDASTNPINDLDDDDFAAPYYDRDAAPSQPLSAFSGQNSAGAWKLNICDAVADDDGEYYRS